MHLAKILTIGLESAGLRCPYCDQRTAHAEGACVYLCQNPDCPGSDEGSEAGRHASMLIITATLGVRLVPWEAAQRINHARLLDPLAALYAGRL